MWAWFYHPSTLPPSYNRWISSASGVDPRLVTALRQCRSGQLVYGHDEFDGVSADDASRQLLQPMCAEHGWPTRWGDPAVSVPFPCTLVHQGIGGVGESCEKHAALRWAKAFGWSLAMYLPLSLTALAARHVAPPPAGGARRVGRRRAAALARSLVHALLSASRSAAFLATFVAAFYYGVCLCRTRVGPRFLPLLADTPTAARQRIDSGLCVACGCALAGPASILLETPGRRKDMALFVAPRALATLLPRRYDVDKQWRETAVFAASAAVVLTCAREDRRRVRGVFGELLGSVLEM
jgi:hypothetical protein